jgi:alkaline phosphatase D
MKPNRPPSEGWQFFGTLDIDPATKVLTARLWNVAGRELFRQELVPV